MRMTTSKKRLPPVYDFNHDPDEQLDWLDKIDVCISEGREFYAKRNAEKLLPTLRHIANNMKKPTHEFSVLCKDDTSLSVEELKRKAASSNQLRQLQDDFHWDAMRLQRYAEIVDADRRNSNAPKKSPHSIFPERQMKSLSPELLLAVHFIYVAIRPYVGLSADDDKEIRGRADQGRGEPVWGIEALLWGHIHFSGSERLETSNNEIHESGQLKLAKLLLEHGIENAIYHVGLSKQMYEQYGKYFEIQGLLARDKYFQEVYEHNASHGQSADAEVGSVMPLLIALDAARYHLSKNQTLPPLWIEKTYPSNGFLTPFSLDYLTHIDTLTPFLEQLLAEYLKAFISEPRAIYYHGKGQQPQVWSKLKQTLITTLSALSEEQGGESLWVDADLFGNQPGVAEGLLALQGEGLLAITDIHVEKKENKLVCQLLVEDFKCEAQDSSALRAEEVVVTKEWKRIHDFEICSKPLSVKKDEKHFGIESGKSKSEKARIKKALFILEKFIPKGGLTLPSSFTNFNKFVAGCKTKNARTVRSQLSDANWLLNQLGSRCKIDYGKSREEYVKVKIIFA